MQFVKKIIVNTIFAVQVLLVFLLLFESSLEMPAWLQAFGRLHPLLLHLPIGLLLLIAVLLIVRKNFDQASFDVILSFLLHLTAITTSFTALMGFFLSQEGGYAESDLLWHKWLGVSLSFFCWLLLLLEERKKGLMLAVAISSVVLIVTGHLGANLTHGENFVWAPLQPYEFKHRVITDSSTVYEAAIEPIFEAKCFGCHNERKAKGKLVLTSIENILKGGKDGALWKAHDSDNSLLTQRLLLSMADEKHMPPTDKPQLGEDEIQLMVNWIASGADVKVKLNQLLETDTLKKLSVRIIPRYQHVPVEGSTYHFAFASSEELKKLNTPYRTIFQIARNEPALQADFFVRQAFEKNYLEELINLKEQLISINLSNMPVNDTDLTTIAQFKNLEKLNLNNTDITGQGLQNLASLSKLNSLSLAGTKVKSPDLATIASIKSLKEVYVWNTGVTVDDIKALQSQNKNIDWQIGYVPDKNEVLRLSPPLVKNENFVLDNDEQIVLKNNLPGTTIRYTLNGSIPDSVSGPVYQKPISLTGYTVINARTCKEGWLSSTVSKFIFFKKGIQPQRAELITPADERYKSGGAAVLIDGKKGTPDQFYDPQWLGYHTGPFAAYFLFEGPAHSIKTVTFSFANNISSYIMPPLEIELWGGSDKLHLNLLKKIKPHQPTGYEPNSNEGIVMDIEPSSFACYKIIAKPVAKLPLWHNGKGEKGWIMVDEVFFNE